MIDHLTSVPTTDRTAFNLFVSRALTVLHLPAPAVATLTGVALDDVAGLTDGSFVLDDTHPGRSELVGVVELYRTLLLRSGSEAAVRRWLGASHPVLGAVPADLVGSSAGLRRVLAHLRAHRD
jgi:hypothetical protein